MAVEKRRQVSGVRRQAEKRAQCRVAPGARDGSALIVVLWVIGLLSVLVASLTFDAHVESYITRYYRNRSKATHLARSGTAVAELLMHESRKIGAGQTEAEDPDDRWFDSAKRLKDGLALRGGSRVVEQLGDGEIRLEIVPDPGRRNINKLREEDWERIFETADIPEEYWPTLIDSFYDWTDKDDTARLDGAETEDHYATLETPYEAKNGPLDTVGELLLVRGFTRSILYGGVLNPESEDNEPIVSTGIADMLTTYGDKNGRVNVNAASMRVLMTLPGVDEIVAGAILEEREGLAAEGDPAEDTSFRDVNDLFARIPGLDPGIKNYVTTDSTIYRIRSVGDVHGVEREVGCIAKYENGKLTILRWWEDMPPEVPAAQPPAPPDSAEPAGELNT